MEAGKALGVKTKGNIAVKTVAADAANIKRGAKAYYVVASELYATTSGAGSIEVGVFQSSVKNDDLAVVKIDIVA